MNGITITDKATMAHEFNMYFIKSVQELTQNFDCPTTVIDSEAVDISNLFCIKEVNEAKILEVIKNLSNSKAKDINNLDTLFIKKHSIDLVKPLTRLVNLSIRDNKFPNNWKKAIATPIFKTGDCDLISNYRPISILPALSKVLEKVVASQVIEHLETNQLLHPQQFGFRPKHSTETANIFFIESIKQSLDSGNVVGAVFLDLKKAFDTVNHSILLSKLKSFKFSKGSPRINSWSNAFQSVYQ